MPAWTTEDLAAMFEDDGLLMTTAEFSHAGGAASTIKVIFDSDFQAVNLGTGQVESAGPQVTCKSSDVSTAVHGDTLTVNSVAYKIIGIQPDGTGITVLILSRD